MEKLENIYREGFFKGRFRLDWRKKPVCDAVINTFKLKEQSTIIDVGCAIGEYVKYFNESCNMQAKGIEGSIAAEKYAVSKEIIYADLRDNLTKCFLKKFDVCMSLEVAEHIEPSFADKYIANLISFSDRILITAAKPGQEGHHHVNCQMSGYWQYKFFSHKYRRNFEKEYDFKKSLENFAHRKEINVYRKNVMVFERI